MRLPASIGARLRRLPLPVLLVLIMSACSISGPSYDEFARRVSAWPGTPSEDCGVGLLGEASRETALECAQRAIAEGRPFAVIVQVQGIDSNLFQGLASRGRRDSFLFWFDSDITGGGGPGAESRLTERPCTDPAVTTNDLPLECQ